jgi:hypothetical protein
MEDRIIGFLVRVGGKWYIRRRVRAHQREIALVGVGAAAAALVIGAVAIGVASQRQPPE